jgi:hypothetical protein
MRRKELQHLNVLWQQDAPIRVRNRHWRFTRRRLLM